ncbi:unnamed protein product [Rhizophagus irregularis]|nr:unnamed protein product [Rhizophagus irregularis]CAB5376518.1 unnamed protein product [Rhizophagus irregularis]
MLEDLSILRKKRSEETGLQLPEITRKYLQGKTQKAVKIYNLFEKIIDNISEQNLCLNGNSSDDSSRIDPVARSENISLGWC